DDLGADRVATDDTEVGEAFVHELFLEGLEAKDLAPVGNEAAANSVDQEDDKEADGKVPLREDVLIDKKKECGGDRPCLGVLEGEENIVECPGHVVDDGLHGLIGRRLCPSRGRCGIGGRRWCRRRYSCRNTCTRGSGRRSAAGRRRWP